MKTLQLAARKVEKLLEEKRIALTLGGEPSYVPIEPKGPEWSVTAVGPTKLDYAYNMGRELIKTTTPNGVLFYSPGKSYPGEVNPRWAVHLVWRPDGQPFAGEIASPAPVAKPKLAPALKAIAKTLKIKPNWLSAEKGVAVLPIDFQDGKFVSEPWPFEGGKIELTAAAGPAGLRLPLYRLPEDALRRALVIEPKDDALHVFLPPLMQAPFVALYAAIDAAIIGAGFGQPIYEGYVPSDEGNLWQKLSLTPDPGVLEINLPPCRTWADYDRWLRTLEAAAKATGLRSHKVNAAGQELGTGGGNHLLFGGPSLDDHPFFTRPGWLTSIIRYWQHHPSLSYLFTGSYVGASSQAPRPDESTRELYDLEMAYQFLETLRDGDHRYLISETLRHLHTDTSGNTHRSEVSLDKFWNVNWDGGCRGLIEFRAVESLPKAEWMSAVALLWKALAALLLTKPFRKPLLDHGLKLYDFYFLPTLLWQDFTLVLRDLAKMGIELPEKLFAEIWNWRFPTMLEFADGPATLTIRKGLEGWPLLCETPLEGGNTSRFVDTSMERVELIASPAFAKKYRVFAQGRELPLHVLTPKLRGAGLRYRRTALYPSLHPGVSPHMPLALELASAKKSHLFELKDDDRRFEPSKHAPAEHQPSARKLKPELLTYDLRLS